MREPHSVPGIISFVVSIIASFAMIALIAIAGIMAARHPGGMDEESVEAIVVGLGIIATGMVHIGAMILGVIGLFQQDRNKIFAILGVLISGMVALGTIGLFILGLTMK